MADIIIKEKELNSNITTNICATFSRAVCFNPIAIDGNYDLNLLVCKKDVCTLQTVILLSADRTKFELRDSFNSRLSAIPAWGGTVHVYVEYEIKYLLKREYKDGSIRYFENGYNQISQTEADNIISSGLYNRGFSKTISNNSENITVASLGTYYIPEKTKITDVEVEICVNELDLTFFGTLCYVEIADSFYGIYPEIDKESKGAPGRDENLSYEIRYKWTNTLTVNQDANDYTMSDMYITIDPEPYTLGLTLFTDKLSSGGGTIPILFKYRRFEVKTFNSGDDLEEEVWSDIIREGIYSLYSNSTGSGTFINNRTSSVLLQYYANSSNTEEKTFIIVVTYNDVYGSCTQRLNSIYLEKASTDEYLLYLKFGTNNTSVYGSFNSVDTVSGLTNPVKLNTSCSWTANGLLITNVSRGSYAAYMNIGSSSPYLNYLISNLQSYEVGCTIDPVSMNSYSNGGIVFAQLGNYGSSNTPGSYPALSKSYINLMNNPTSPYKFVYKRYLNGSTYHLTYSINGVTVGESDGGDSLRRSSTTYSPLYFGVCPWTANTNMSYVLKEFYIKKI